MNLLAIETSTSVASVALSMDEKIEEETKAGVTQHATHILPMIDSLMQRLGCQFQDLDALVMGEGPGSFTGVRIACSVVKGLAYAHDLPVYTVTSTASVGFEVFQQQSKSDGLTLAVLDARMQEVYWQCFDNAKLNAGRPTALDDIRVTDPGDVTVPANRDVLLAGVGFEPYLPDLPVQTTQVVQPAAASMIAYVKAGALKALSAADIMPHYVRNEVVRGASSG